MVSRSPSIQISTQTARLGGALATALALLLTVMIGTIVAVAGLDAIAQAGTWLRGATLLINALTLPQWLFPASWALGTGAVFSLGLGSQSTRWRAVLLAMLCGVLIPVGLVLLSLFMVYLWPALRNTTGPFDRPLLTLPLVIYGALAPWLLGWAARKVLHPQAPAP